MADGDNKQQSTKQSKTPLPRAEADPVEERTYTRDRLIAESFAFFGEEGHVVAGALADERKQNFTLDDAKALVSNFRKRPVSTD